MLTENEDEDDGLILYVGGAYLTRYDGKAFGLLEAYGKREDPEVRDQALHQAIESMNQWLAEHEASKDGKTRQE